MKSKVNYFAAFIFLVFNLSCQKEVKKPEHPEINKANTYLNPLLPTGARPWAVFYKQQYYYLQDSDSRIVLWKTGDITDLKNAQTKEIWIPKEKSNAFHLWSPKMYRINDKWYIYFTADDGNTDNHRIYVLENKSDDPFESEFTMKGRIKTDKNDNWAIHPSMFKQDSTWYMVWSGWQTRRIETETQCIYIARMENPWTLASNRVLISKPEYEWERQWINPDGSKTGYPIYVNEDPRYFHTKNKDKALIYYSASGTWTPYYAVGLLYADAGSDLLNPGSWTKSTSPVFSQKADNQVFATGSPCFIPSPDGKEIYFLYHARATDKEPYGSLPVVNIDTRSPRLQKMEWDEDGFPQLGIALSEDERLPKPSGTK